MSGSAMILWYFVVYAVSILGGWGVVGACMWVMRKAVKAKKTALPFRWLDLFVGGAERLVATTLVVCAPSYLAAFIGGWTALKFAAHWQKESNDSEGSLLFLVGTVLSFAVAIASGCLLNPNAIQVWAKTQ